MTLGALARAARAIPPEAVGRLRAAAANRDVTGIAHDSRGVSPGGVFVAIRGHRADGATFAADAVARGAVAIVSETPAPAGFAVPWFVTDDARHALAELAALFHGRPSEELTVVGVTGTNGKTTTTYLAASVLDAAGMPSGRLGTVSYRVGPSAKFERDPSHTTPEASDVQALLRELRTNGCTACVMEVSSHALALQRVAEMRFAAAVFTNLTRDHLDFHGDMGAYFAAKRRLFETLPAGAPAVVNLDDPRGAELATSLPRVLTYGLDGPAQVRAQSVDSSLEGLAFDVETPRGPISIRSPLIGRPNAYNILAAVALGVALELPAEAIERGIAALESVPGRFQIVSGSDDDVRLVVDYAHTDDALKNLLETLRPLADGRLIVVFGCGGDRDRTKRPLMGAVAGRLGDLVVLTSDNPRSEDPGRIIDEIKLGLLPPAEPGAPRRAGPASMVQPDRRKAIEYAVRQARAGDVIVVAGKGHEKYQVIGDRTLAFDDVEVGRAALGGRRAASRA